MWSCTKAAYDEAVGCSVESVMGGPSLGSKRLPLGSRRRRRRASTTPTARRSRAFRAGLVRAVALLHDRFLQQLRDGRLQWEHCGWWTLKAKVRGSLLSASDACHAATESCRKVKAPCSDAAGIGRLQPLTSAVSRHVSSNNLFNAQSRVKQFASLSWSGKASKWRPQVPLES